MTPAQLCDPHTYPSSLVLFQTLWHVRFEALSFLYSLTQSTIQELLSLLALSWRASLISVLICSPLWHSSHFNIPKTYFLMTVIGHSSYNKGICTSPKLIILNSMICDNNNSLVVSIGHVNTNFLLWIWLLQSPSGQISWYVMWHLVTDGLVPD